MAATYIGIVTRKDVPTGVTLRAKIVTPSGKKHAYQDFKTMIKSTGISDLAACILDLNSTTALLADKGITSVTQNITSAMPSQGEHGTTITYKFESIGSEDITEYITDEGIVKKRPLYGSTAVTGKIVIEVSKNIESVSSKMDIVITPFTIEEVFVNAQDLILWNDIRGRNAVETTDSSSGLKNVQYPLNLITKLENVKGCSVPITVSWTCVDTLQGLAESLTVFNGPRVATTGTSGQIGTVTRPSYTAAYKLYNAAASSYGITIVVGSVPMIRMGGVTLTATLEIGDASKTSQKTFTLSTLSKYLTNTEVSAWLDDNLKLSLDDGSSYKQMNTSSAIINLIETEVKSDVIVTVPKSASGFGPGTGLGLERVNADVVIRIVDFSSTEQQKTFPPAVTTGAIVDEDAGLSRITFHLDMAHDLTDAEKKFCIRGDVNVWSYSSDGIILGGEPSVSQSIWKLALSVLADPPVE